MDFDQQIENNTLIAKFLNMKCVKGEEDEHGYIDYEWEPAPEFQCWQSKTPPPFNSCWNWLMMAVDKIETMGQILVFFEVGEQKERMVKFMGHEWYGFGSNKFHDTKIEAVWKSVVNFIEKHNDKK